MIREPDVTTDLFMQNKQPWRLIVNGRTSFGDRVRAEVWGGK